MTLSDRLDKISRGNTCPGVNRAVIEYLLSLNTAKPGTAVLDIPCGEGDLLNAIKDFFSDWDLTGSDIVEPSGAFQHRFILADARTDQPSEPARQYDIVTCISGVMEFDNTLAFFERVHSRIASEGRLIVSNDNLLTVRDRILYLLFGRYSQYPLFIGNDKPTWKTLSLHNLLRILNDAGFSVEKVDFVRPASADWLWSPIAIPLHLIGRLYYKLSKKKAGSARTNLHLPFTSLLSRHYIVTASPTHRG